MHPSGRGIVASFSCCLTLAMTLRLACWLQALSRKLALQPGTEFGHIARECDGMTGADLGALLSEAQLLAVHERLAATAAADPSSSQVEAAEVLPSAPSTAPNTPSVTACTDVLVAECSSAAAVQPSQTNQTDSQPSVSMQQADVKAIAFEGIALGIPVICMHHLRQALSKARPSLPVSEQRRLQAIYDRFLQSRGKGLPAGDVHSADSKKATLA